MANIVCWNPMMEMAGMRDQMDRIFEDFFSRGPTSLEGYGVVNMDMMQTADNVIVEVSIPGIKSEDINISVAGDTLTIRGDIKTDEEVKVVNYHVREIKRGSFARSVLLPTQVISDKAKAEFENGILKLTLPKAEEAKPKTISIKVK